MKNQGNIVFQKGNNSPPGGKKKKGVLSKWKTIQNGHCEEAQENSERHYNEIRNSIAQKEFFTKETEALKNQQTKILELKNSINKMKNSLESTGNRADRVEEIVSSKI